MATATPTILSSVSLDVELGALQEIPCIDGKCLWESHKRGKNWCAVVHKDPTAPGGLGRAFLDKAKGNYYYMVASLKRGDTLEFGADYYSGGGTPSRKRGYFVVASIDATSLVLDRYASAAEAINASAAEAINASAGYAVTDATPSAHDLAVAQIRALMTEHGISAMEL